MKLGSIAKTLAGVTLALTLVAAPAMAGDHHDKSKLYPNATRQAPKLDLHSQKDAKALNKGLNAVNSGDAATAKKILGPLAAGTASKSKYVQALALQGMGTIKYQKGDLKGAIADLKKSLAIGVMPNDSYFQIMFELAQMELANQQYADALKTLQTWRNEGKRESAKSYALEGNIDYRLQKYSDAVTAMKKAMSMTPNPKASWTQLLMASYAESGNKAEAVKLAEAQLKAHPKDTDMLRNAVSMLVGAQQYPEALKLMEQARANGAVTSAKDYITTAKLYLIIAQNAKDPKTDAEKAYGVVQDGLAKGILPKDYKSYLLMGDAANVAGDYKKAIAAYDKASPTATDGNADVRRAQLLYNQGKKGAAKKAVARGIKLGVKHMGEAYMLQAEIQQDLREHKAAVKSMKMAAGYPETHDKAEAWLKKRHR